MPQACWDQSLQQLALLQANEQPREKTYPYPKYSSSDDWQDPVNRGKSRPGEPKQPDRHKHRPDDDGGQAELRLALAGDARGRLVPVDEPHADLLPDAARHGTRKHAEQQAQERQARLPQVEAEGALEDEWEGPEEEVQDPQEDGRVEVEDERHGLEEQDLEGPEERVAHGPEKGFVGLFDRSSPPLVARVLALLLGLVAQHDGVCGDSRLT